MRVLKSLFLGLCLLSTTIITAQVNIQLRNSGSTFEVWLVPQATYTNVVPSSLTFTISWDASYNFDLGATGTETAHLAEIPLQVSGNMSQTTITDGSKKYRVYAGSGATPITLTNGVDVKVLSIPTTSMGNTATWSFSISDDAYTTANNFDYYFETDGVTDITGGTSSLVSNVVLPVSLTQFSAKAQGNDAVLTWLAKDFAGFSHFEIERSQDGKVWKSVEMVKNSSNTEGGYFWSDVGILSQNNLVFYRLKLVNLDKTFFYSKIQSVAAAAIAKNTLKIQTNPVQEMAIVTIESAKEGTQHAEILDITGRVVQRVVFSLNKGQNTQNLEVNNLPAGLYLLTILENYGFKKSVKFVKQ